MPTTRNDVLKESAFETAADWSVSHGKRFRANIIIWGMRKQYSYIYFFRLIVCINFNYYLLFFACIYLYYCVFYFYSTLY